jgi:hypothetical protein
MLHDTARAWLENVVVESEALFSDTLRPLPTESSMNFLELLQLDHDVWQ